MLNARLRINSLLSVLIIFNLVSVMISASGCEPLRKKFIREKKKDKVSNFVPVLDPIDYQPAVHTAKEHYSQHYSMWKVWQRDFLDVADASTSDKRQKYTLTQAMAQLEEMKKWIVNDKQTELNSLIAELQEVEAEFNKPAPVRNSYLMRRKFETVAKQIQHEFKPNLMEDSFIK